MPGNFAYKRTNTGEFLLMIELPKSALCWFAFVKNYCCVLCTANCALEGARPLGYFKRQRAVIGASLALDLFAFVVKCLLCTFIEYLCRSAAALCMFVHANLQQLWLKCLGKSVLPEFCSLCWVGMEYLLAQFLW